jgi:hypothetical protein
MLPSANLEALRLALLCLLLKEDKSYEGWEGTKNHGEKYASHKHPPIKIAAHL